MNSRGNRPWLRFGCLALCVCAASGADRQGGGSAEPASMYRIGPGDVLHVSVWKEPDASLPEVLVRSDGMISLPLVKEVQATGLTVAELERTITERLGQYINAPEVTVIVRQVRSKRAYVVGGVRREGPVELNAPTTVLQAIVQAGGLTDYAKKTKIYVLRAENGKETRLPFNYTAVIKGERAADNVVLEAGDTIVVPQ